MAQADEGTGVAPGAEPRQPAHERIYRQLRDLVLYGDLAPGQAVTIQGLTARLGAGMTPVREAIRRLIAEGRWNSRATAGSAFRFWMPPISAN